ncbi:3,4-dihydroxy-2-butanone-4-phosphate synthase [Methylobrevis albus]|nr:3,4-dihydroxy-2-butanone-4-phosphate synthase [Methylobrevis albus]
MNTMTRSLEGAPLARRLLETAGWRAAPVAISSPEEIIAEAKAGRMVVLVDDEDRENEGDLVIPAVHADPAAINFMARNACGLVCLAITEEQARRLALAPMTAAVTARFTTAFTVSVEAAEGVTTGISAHDRARTVAAVIAEDAVPADVVMPGHIFPIVARDGGVLVRPGHTEAAVDLSRLAGLPPSGVICEIMNEDGSMARLPDLLLFAGRHGLKVGTIADLVAWRRAAEA